MPFVRRAGWAVAAVVLMMTAAALAEDATESYAWPTLPELGIRPQPSSPHVDVNPPCRTLETSFYRMGLCNGTIRLRRFESQPTARAVLEKEIDEIRRVDDAIGATVYRVDYGTVEKGAAELKRIVRSVSEKLPDGSGRPVAIDFRFLAGCCVVAIDVQFARNAPADLLGQVEALGDRWKTYAEAPVDWLESSLSGDAPPSTPPAIPGPAGPKPAVMPDSRPHFSGQGEGPESPASLAPQDRSRRATDEAGPTGRQAADFVVLAQQCLWNEQWREAVDNLDHYFELQPASQWDYPLAMRALAYHRLGDTAAATRDFGAALKAWPESPWVHFYRGLVHRDQGKVDEALADLTRVTEYDPAHADAYCELGMLYGTAKRDNAKAKACFEEALRIEPSHPQALWGCAILHMRLDSNSPALEYLTRALECHPDKAQCYNARGVVYARLGEPDRAIADYTRAIEANPQFGEAFRNRGYRYLQKGELDAALGDLDRAIELEPRHAKAHADRGAAYLARGALSNALADLTRAIELDPRLTGAYENRGRVYLKLGRRAQAEQDFATARKLRN